MRLRDLMSGDISFVEQLLTLLAVERDIFQTDIAALEKSLADFQTEPSDATRATLWASVATASDSVDRWVDSKPTGQSPLLDALAKLGKEEEDLRRRGS